MSVVEFAWLSSRDGEGDAMERGFVAAVAELQGADGALHVAAHRCVEDGDRFLLEVQWTSVEAHMAYRETEGFQAFRSHIGGLLAGAPEFAHWQLVAS